MVVENGERKIKFCDDIVFTMQKYIQFDKKACEAGGILIGRENIGNKNLIIDFITEPMRSDRRGRYRYSRKDKGHLQFYQEVYEKNKGIYAYIGEWHTHPENVPEPSSIDTNNWRKIGNEMKGGFQYHLIIGMQEVGVWENNANIKIIRKLDSIKWKRINLEE